MISASQPGGSDLAVRMKEFIPNVRFEYQWPFGMCNTGKRVEPGLPTGKTDDNHTVVTAWAIGYLNWELRCLPVMVVVTNLNRFHRRALSHLVGEGD